MVRALEWVGIGEGMYLDRSQSLYVLCVLFFMKEEEHTNASEGFRRRTKNISFNRVYLGNTIAEIRLRSFFVVGGVTNEQRRTLEK